MAHDDDWREFERLVARIERDLAPQGAVVRSPDRVPDLVTGSLREVDASIRFKVGSSSILITIECRRRGAVQDDTWIEQLASKKEKVGAAKTIAVSSSGFSEPAKITAKLKGIDLRNLREITDEEILAWLRAVVFERRGLHLKILGIYTELDQGGPVVHYRIQREMASIGMQQFIRVCDQKPVPWFAVLNTAMDSKPRPLVDVPLDGSKQCRLLKVNLPAGAAQVKTPDGLQRIRSICFELECHYKIKGDLLTSGAHYEYADSSGTIVQRSEFNTELAGIPIILSMQSGPDSKSLPPKFGLRVPESETRDRSPDPGKP